MRYLAKTFRYLKRSCLPLALIAAIPAFALAATVRPISVIGFLPAYFLRDIGNFGDIFWLLASHGKANFWQYPIMAILIFVFFALTLAIIEKHFKTGSLNGKGSLLSLNNNFIPAFISLGFISLVLVIAIVLQASLTTLTHSLISGPGRPAFIDCVYAAIIALLIFAAVMVAVLPMMYWGPVMQIFGYSFADAAVETAHLIGKKLFSLIVGLALPLLVAAFLGLGLSFVPLRGVGGIAFRLVTDTVLHGFVLVYSTAYVMVSIFDITGLERRDERKYGRP